MIRQKQPIRNQSWSKPSQRGITPTGIGKLANISKKLKPYNHLSATLFCLSSLYWARKARAHCGGVGQVQKPLSSSYHKTAFEPI